MSDAALHWNTVLLDTALIDSGKPGGQRDQEGPTHTSRAAAIMHLAMHDAVNGVDPRFPAYSSTRTDTGVSASDAAGGAAHAVLVELYPAQKEVLDKKLKDFGGPTPGTAFGALVATDLLIKRAHDCAALPVSYVPTPGPGCWQPDPVLAPPGDPLTPRWGKVRTFALPGVPTVPAVPALGSSRYRASRTQVYGTGYRDTVLPSTAPAGAVARTADESDAAYFWAYDDALGSPIRLYNQIVQQVVAAAPQDAPADALHRHARLFAVANMAMADAAIAAWHVKFADDFWRPFQAIRAEVDPAWLPLGRPHATTPAGAVPHATPNFPAYVSGHSTIGGALFGILRKYYEAIPPFDLRLFSDMTANPRTFPSGGAAPNNDSWGLASTENSFSRLWLGVHWDFDLTEGASLGQQVADAGVDGRAVELTADPGRRQRIFPVCRVPAYGPPHPARGGNVARTSQCRGPRSHTARSDHHAQR